MVTDPNGAKTIKVSTFPGLATTGQLVMIDATHAVKRTGSATFVAFSRFCTHEGTVTNLSGSGFLCPNHLSQFDNDGRVTVGPATRNLTQFVTAYDAATDMLTVG